MKEIEILEYPELPCRDGKAEKLVVFLHGVGSDGNDLIALAPFFSRDIKGAHFISPHGIESFDMAPFGRQWFSLVDRTPIVIIEAAEQNYPIIDSIIKEKQKQLGLTNKETIIIGFSQGAMMGLYLALTSTEPYNAMIAFSGRVIPPKTLNNKNTPICLIHGLEDDIVPAEESEKTAEFFDAVGINYEKLMIPNLTHSIDSTGIEFACEFLNKYLK